MSGHFIVSPALQLLSPWARRSLSSRPSTRECRNLHSGLGKIPKSLLCAPFERSYEAILRDIRSRRMAIAAFFLMSFNIRRQPHPMFELPCCCSRALSFLSSSMAVCVRFLVWSSENSLTFRLTARASGLTPFSINDTQMDSVVRSRPVFCSTSIEHYWFHDRSSILQVVQIPPVLCR